LKKELLFKSFETLKVKAHVKVRLFAVLIISFLFQIHLYGAAIKITHEEGSLAFINTNGSVDVPSHPNDLENIIVSDTIRQAANISTAKAEKQFQENSTKIIPSKKVSQESPDVQEEEDKTIFVTAGTTVFGLDQIYQVKVATIPEISQLNKVTKSTFLEKTNKTLSEKKADKKLARLVKKIQEEAKFHFSVSTGGNSKITSALHENKTAVVVPSHIVQKHALASTYDQLILKIESQLQKQKFYTSLSYLQFGKFRSSSLRGPPYAA
jgi:hypothetical protein